MLARTNIRRKRFEITSDDVEKDIDMKTFRFNFTDEFMVELSDFAKLHRYDDRKSFKIAWEKWIETDYIVEMIKLEISSLIDEKYDGDIMKKMFVSARYYYKKKPLIEPENKESKKRKDYISLSPIFLEKIDRQTLELIDKHSSPDGDKNWVADLSPADAYAIFCKNNKDIILEQIIYLRNKYGDELDETELCSKFKKTYKNRFHIMKNTLETIHK
jgi:hypothetical protein